MQNFNIIVRTLLRQKLNTGIIITSLAIGMSTVNLIALFIQRELNTDAFQTNKGQIYALTCDDPFNEGRQMFQCREGSVEYMKTNFTQVEDFCRVSNRSAQKVIVNKEAYFDRPNIIGASKNFFDFFNYKLLTNNPKTALEAENSLVISEDLARKYFGTDNAIGQVISLANRDKEESMVVTGVFRKPTDNSQLNFEIVRSMGNKDSHCFVGLSPKANPNELEALLKANKTSIPIIHADKPGQYHLESLVDSYFNTSSSSSLKSSRDKSDLWIAFIIGLVIVSIATFNYLGLLNNNLLEKNKRYAIQRVNGGSKFSFIMNFMTESLIVVSISFLLSLFLMAWIAPFFNGLTNSNISLGYLIMLKHGLILFAIMALLLTITFLFVVFKIHNSPDISTLKPFGSRVVNRIQVPAFNIFQLASSLVLIIISIIIVKQTIYIAQKSIGMDKQVFEVKIPGQFADKVSVFKEELKKKSAIGEVSIAAASPVLEHFLVLLNYKQNGVEKEYSPAGFTGDENYISTLGIQLIEGSGFSGNPESDKTKCLINESLAKLFPNQNLMGRGLPGMESRIVTGIVKDFHYSSLKSMVEPAIIVYNPSGLNLLVKASDNQIAQAKEAIAQVWKQMIPDYPLNTETIGDRYEWLHRENKKYLELIGSCCLISLFLSMIGLFAISFQSNHCRTKEIGIRKINGAKVSEVMAMLSRDFVKWVVIAFLIATPIAYYFMHKWLENFAYKTELSWWIFALAGLLALGIALLTVSWHTWKAATRNPVEALRYE